MLHQKLEIRGEIIMSMVPSLGYGGDVLTERGVEGYSGCVR